jgi:hypothetical protein
MDALRDAYLEYLGGQTKVFCGLLHTPMIPAVKVRGLCRTCSVVEEHKIRCTIKAYLCCAFDNCNAAGCTHHSKGGGGEEQSSLYIDPIADVGNVDGVKVVVELDMGGSLLENDGVGLTDGDGDDEVEVEVASYDEQMFVTDNYMDWMNLCWT